MSFDRARAIADAVLFEGYVLYPYRATAPKNQFRWAFGVLAPRTWSESGGCEPWWMATTCLVEPGRWLEGRLRFLHPRRRTIEARDGDGYRAVPSLEVDGELWLPWEEGEIREVDFACETDGRTVVPFAIDGSVDVEELQDADGTPVGRVVRRQDPVRGTIHVDASAVDAPRPLVRLEIRVENDDDETPAGMARDEALRRACIGAHLLLATDGAFVSLLDPPDWASDAAAACTQTRCWPVLAGPPGERDLVLAAPIILYDHPQLAPESPGDFFDACEIDELLSLRTATLTPEEKREARATDPRAAALIDRVERLGEADWTRMHGTFRDVDGGEMVPAAVPRGGGPVHDDEAAKAAGIPRGSRVVLRPGKRRTDAQDLLFAGMTATVEAVLWDVDGRPHLALTIDGDPGADLHRWYGRFHYYQPDEVEPVQADAK